MYLAKYPLYINVIAVDSKKLYLVLFIFSSDYMSWWPGLPVFLITWLSNFRKNKTTTQYHHPRMGTRLATIHPENQTTSIN
jgi:hypothetical protein